MAIQKTRISKAVTVCLCFLLTITAVVSTFFMNGDNAIAQEIFHYTVEEDVPSHFLKKTITEDTNIPGIYKAEIELNNRDTYGDAYVTLVLDMSASANIEDTKTMYTALLSQFADRNIKLSVVFFGNEQLDTSGSFSYNGRNYYYSSYLKHEYHRDNLSDRYSLVRWGWHNTIIPDGVQGTSLTNITYEKSCGDNGLPKNYASYYVFYSSGGSANGYFDLSKEIDKEIANRLVNKIANHSAAKSPYDAAWDTAYYRHLKPLYDANSERKTLMITIGDFKSTWTSGNDNKQKDVAFHVAKVIQGKEKLPGAATDGSVTISSKKVFEPLSDLTMINIMTQNTTRTNSTSSYPNVWELAKKTTYPLPATGYNGYSTSVYECKDRIGADWVKPADDSYYPNFYYADSDSSFQNIATAINNILKKDTRFRYFPIEKEIIFHETLDPYFEIIQGNSQYPITFGVARSESTTNFYHQDYATYALSSMSASSDFSNTSKYTQATGYRLTTYNNATESPTYANYSYGIVGTRKVSGSTTVDEITMEIPFNKTIVGKPDDSSSNTTYYTTGYTTGSGATQTTNYPKYKLTYYFKLKDSVNVTEDETVYTHIENGTVAGSSTVFTSEVLSNADANNYITSATLDGYTSAYLPGTQITLTPKNYDIIFDSNNYVAENRTTKTQSMTYGATENLDENTFRECYSLWLDGNKGTVKGVTSLMESSEATFLGWAETRTGNVVYTDEAAVTNLADPGGSKTLYAKWVAQIELPEPSRSGYYFVGWCENKEGKGTKYSAGTEYQLTGNGVTLFAQWEDVPTYTVTYNYTASGGTSVNMGTTNNVFYEDSGAMFDPSPVAYKEGYEFLGWTLLNPNLAGEGKNYSFEYWGTNSEECDECIEAAVKYKHGNSFYDAFMEFVNDRDRRPSLNYYNNLQPVPIKLDENFELANENITVYAVFVKEVPAYFSVIDTDHYYDTGEIQEEILTEYGYVYNNDEYAEIYTPSYDTAEDGGFDEELYEIGITHEYWPEYVFIRPGESFDPVEDDVSDSVQVSANEDTPTFYSIYSAPSYLRYNGNLGENDRTLNYLEGSFAVGYYMTAPTLPSPYSYYWCDPVDNLGVYCGSWYDVYESLGLTNNKKFTGWTIPGMTGPQYRYNYGDMVPFAGIPNTDITFSPEAIMRDNTAYAQWLSSSITADKDTVAPGKEITYTVSATTTGDGTQMVLLADIPANTTFVESADGEEYTEQGNNYVKFTIDDVLEGTDISFTYTVRVNDDAPVNSVITAGLDTTLYVKNIEGGISHSVHQPEDAETTVERLELTITYDYAANGGTGLTDGEETISINDEENIYIKTFEPGVTFGDATAKLNSPVGIKNGWEFYGWSTNVNYNRPILSTYVMTENITVYAIYRKAVYADFSGYYTYDPETGKDTPIEGMGYAWNNSTVAFIDLPVGFDCSDVPCSDTYTYEEGKLVDGGYYSGYFINKDINGENVDDYPEMFMSANYCLYDGTPVFYQGAPVDINAEEKAHMFALYYTYPAIWFDSNGGQEEYTYENSSFVEATEILGATNRAYFENSDVETFINSDTGSILSTAPTKESGDTFTGWNIQGYNSPEQRYMPGENITVGPDSPLLECDHLATAQWLTSEITAASDGDYVAGHEITYTISGTTTGGANSLVLVATVPENTVFINDDGSLNPSKTTATFEVSDVAPNTTITRTFKVKIKDNVVVNDEITSNLTAHLYCDAYTNEVLVNDQEFTHQSSVTKKVHAGYKVTYYIGSEVAGTCVAPTDNTVYAAGDEATVLAEGNNLVKTGYTFLGWRDGLDNTNYAPGSKIQITRDVDLYPLWGKVTITTPERWVAPNCEGYAEYVVAIDISQNAKNVTMQLDCPASVDLLDIDIPYIQVGTVMRDRDVTPIERQERGVKGALHDGYTLLIENANSTHYEMTFGNYVVEDLSPGTNLTGKATLHNNYASTNSEVINTIGYEVFYAVGDDFTFASYGNNFLGALKASGSDVIQEEGSDGIPKYYALNAEAKTITLTGDAANGFVGWVPLSPAASVMYNEDAEFTVTGNKTFLAAYAQISQEIKDKEINYIPGEEYQTNITVNCPDVGTYSDYFDIIVEPKTGTDILEILSVKEKIGNAVSDITDDVVITESDGIYTVRITPTEDAAYTIAVKAKVNSSATPNSFTGCLVSMNVETENFLDNDIPFKTFDANEDNVTMATYYTVTYDANTGTGTVPVDMTYYRSGERATVASGETISKDGYVFSGWCTQSDGTSGTTYIPGNEIRVTSNVTLYAIWGTQAALPETGGQTVAIITAIGTFTLLSIGLYLTLKKKSK